MLKFNLHQAESFSGFMQALKGAFSNRNQDIRTTGTTKLLHAAAEAFGMNNWQQLSAALATVTENTLPETSNAEEVRKNDSALEDILGACEKHKQGENVELSDTIQGGGGVLSIDLAFRVASSTTMIINTDSEGFVLNGYIRSSGFGTEAITRFDSDQLELIENAFRGQIMSMLSNLDFDYG